MNLVAGIPISRAKVTLPRRRDELLTRRRLLDLLNELLEKKLILLSAPAGYGKTSLLIDLASHTELPVCWLSLDELDRNPQRWAAYLIASLAERFPNFGAQSMSVLGSMVSLEQDFEAFIVSLTNEIYDQIREHFILILDDYHIVEGTAPIHTLVNRFLRLADENCHVILSSRTLVDLPDLGWFISQEQVGGLDFSALAFRPDEIQRLMAQNFDEAISDEIARSLAEQSEGWITGLQLSGLGGASAEHARLVRASGMDLDHYFEQQVLAQHPVQSRNFLLYSSLFEEFDIEICQSVLSKHLPNVGNWPELISNILVHNLFVLPVGEDGRWLRYHHLFRDFLRSRLQREQFELVRPILTSLMLAYEQRGEWERAHNICLQLNDSDLLAGLIERAGPTMLRRAVVTLSNWLNALPAYLLNSRPGLLSLRGGIGYLRSNFREALELLNEAEAKYRAIGDVNGLALTLLRRATANRNLGDYISSLRDAEEAVKLTEQSPDLQLDHAEAQRVKGLCLYRLGNTRSARECLERSLGLYRHLGDMENIPVLLMNCGLAYRALGENEAAETAYKEALGFWMRQGNLTSQATLLNNMAALYLILGEHEKANMTYQDGLACARRSRYSQTEAMISIGLGDLYAELDEFEGAQQAYQQAGEIVRQIEDPYLINYLALTRAAMHLNRREISDAEEILSTASQRIHEGKSIYEQGLWALLQGRLSLGRGEITDAIELLKNAVHAFSEDGRQLENLQGQVWLMAALASANDAVAIEMAQSLFVGRGTPPHALIIALRQARPWLGSLKANASIGQLLRRVDKFEERLPALRRDLRRLPQTVSLSAPRLVIYGLGWTKVVVNGEVAEWPTQAVRELFFFFLTAPNAMTKEQVAETLWPNIEEPGRLMQRFKNELYRLRRAVGQSTILLHGELYEFNRSVDYDFDVHDFEAYLLKAKNSMNDDENISNYEKAIELVKGPYLADVDSTWAMLDREQLHQSYLSAIMNLAELYWKRNELTKTLEVCQRALEEDPAFESAHQMAMKVHAARRDRNALARQYQSCQEAMSRLLGLPPSQDSENLYKLLSS